MHPVLFKIGPVNIYSFGAMLAAAFLIAAFLAKRRAASLGMDGDAVLDLSLLLVVCGLLGARLLYVLQNISYYRDSPLEAFMFWRGGLVWYGGLALAVVGGGLFLRARRMPLLKTADLISAYVALGQAIGRVGCFLNGCCYGKPTSLPIGMVFDPAQGRVHPTQLYEAAAMFLIFLVLVRRKPRGGETFFLYLALYAAFRFFVEFLRGDNPAVFAALTFPQLISAIVFAVAAAILWRNSSSR